MDIIKLSAIDSTSSFLKEMSKNGDLINFTTVVADAQFKGKGQMNTSWHSADGKNLLFTVYTELKGLSIEDSPCISFLAALKIREVLEQILGDDGRIKIKWPNDIMSYHKKVAGILVENSIRKDAVLSTLVGVGLNVNQEEFPSFLPKAISMLNISGQLYDRDVILKQIINALKKVLNVTYIEANKASIKQEYLKHLYKFNIPTMFQDMEGSVFMGKVVDVSNSGLLIVEKEDDLQYTYAVKEISFL